MRLEVGQVGQQFDAQHPHAALQLRGDHFLQRLVKGAMLDNLPLAKLAWTPQHYTIESAYSHAGPWQQKRGYASLVQLVRGIVHEEIAGPREHCHCSSIMQLGAPMQFGIGLPNLNYVDPTETLMRLAHAAQELAFDAI